MELTSNIYLNENKEIKPSALFICHEKFLNSASLEGGVKFCTYEYLELIKIKFQVITLPVHYTKSWTYRFKMKLGLSAYDAFQPKDYMQLLKKNLDNKVTKIVFLNLTNTIPFAEYIKNNWPNVKVVLCSHGNESGDHLHAISLHKNYEGLFKRTAIYSLGNMLVKESYFRKYIDLVLTVSEVEVGIERWLGAEHVLMVPRFISANNIERKPMYGRVGFLADLTHEPNFYGINEVCKTIKKNGIENIQIHLVGGGSERGAILEQQFSFVSYIGYLPEEKLNIELTTWTFALNPVFYYSRGVSTKLGKALSMGLPVITTDKGMRGYQWKEGKLPICTNPNEMAILIQNISVDVVLVNFYNLEVLKIQSTSFSKNDTANKMMQFLEDS